MGWSFHYDMPDSVKGELDRQLTWSNEHGTRTVLKSALVRLTEYYAAVEHIAPNGERHVWCAVFMVKINKRSECPFGYKDMEESMGPCIAHCPESILDLLSATDNEYALAWRARCRQAIALRKDRPKLSDGVKIAIANAPTWNGVLLDTVTVRRIGKRTRFYHPSLGTFGWPSIRQYQFTLAAE